jgi:excisionase family DNA binding protein
MNPTPKPELELEQYYTIENLVRRLQLSDATIRRYIKDGKLESKKIGKQHRIPKSAVEKFINEQDRRAKTKQI